jgi:hypothetical protein
MKALAIVGVVLLAAGHSSFCERWLQSTAPGNQASVP